MDDFRNFTDFSVVHNLKEYIFVTIYYMKCYTVMQYYVFRTSPSIKKGPDLTILRTRCRIVRQVSNKIRCVVFLFSSCVLYVASFSGLSIYDCLFGVTVEPIYVKRWFLVYLAVIYVRMLSVDDIDHMRD